jgi:hypothetical protein
MIDDDESPSPALALEIHDFAGETARMQRELGAIEAELSVIAGILLQHAPRSGLALDFLRCLGAPGPTLH